MRQDSDGTAAWRAWVLAARPKTLLASVTPVLVGSAAAYAAGGYRAGASLAALFGAVMIQIGTNLANDVVDFEKGVDTGDRLGPLRATQAGLLSPSEVRLGAALAFGLAGMAGVYLTWVAGWPVVILGLASILAGAAYTAGPFPLVSLGLGDVFVLIFFGFVAVGGTAYVQAGYVPAAAWPAAVAVGALATVILGINNVRDMETDRRAGRRTVPVLFGRRAGVLELGLLLLVAYLAPPYMAWTGLSAPFVLLPLLSLPGAFRLFRTVASTQEGPALNQALGQSAGLIFYFGALLALGIVLEVWAG